MSCKTRIISFLLAVAMILGSLSLGTFAAGEPADPETQANGADNTLGSINDLPVGGIKTADELKALASADYAIEEISYSNISSAGFGFSGNVAVNNTNSRLTVQTETDASGKTNYYIKCANASGETYFNINKFSSLATSIEAYFNGYGGRSFTISVDIKLGASWNSSTILTQYASFFKQGATSSAPTYKFSPFNINKDGKIVSNSGGEIVNGDILMLTKGATDYTTISQVIRPDSNQIDLYVNGKLAIKNTTFISNTDIVKVTITSTSGKTANVTANDFVLGWARLLQTSNNTEYSLDNVKIYYADKFVECKHDYAFNDAHTHDYTNKYASMGAVCTCCGEAYTIQSALDSDGDGKCDLCLNLTKKNGSHHTIEEITAQITKNGGEVMAYDAASKSFGSPKIVNTCASQKIGNDENGAYYYLSDSEKNGEFYHNVFYPTPVNTSTFASNAYRGKSFGVNVDIKLGENFSGVTVLQINSYVTEKLLPETNKSSSMKHFPLNINANGYLVSGGKTTTTQLTKDRYYTVSVFVDIDENLCYIYCDGELVTTSTYFSANDIANLTFTVDGVSANGAQDYIVGVARLFQKTYNNFVGTDYYYDNIMFYYADSYIPTKTVHNAQLVDSTTDESGYANLEYACDVCGTSEHVQTTGKDLGAMSASTSDASVVILGRQGALGEDIGFKLYTEIDAATAADPTAKMVISVGDDVKEFALADIKSKNNAFVFPFNLATTEMTKTISAKLVTSNGETGVYETSFEDYALAIINSSADTELIALLKSTLSLGAYAQDYFSEKNSTTYPDPAEKYYEDVLTEADAKLGNAYKLNIKASTDAVRLSGAALVLESATTMKIFFSGTASGVKVNGENTEIFSAKDGYYILIDGIMPYELDKSYTVIFEAADGEVQLSVSVLDCAYIIVSTNTSDAFKNLARSLYYYNETAKAYKA